MISVKIKSKSIILFISLFTSVSCIANDTLHSCSTLGKNKICLLKYIDNYGENSYKLKIGNTEYYRISYYNNAKLKKINEETIEVTTNFSDRGNIDISTVIYFLD